MCIPRTKHGCFIQGFRKINMNQDPTQPPLLQKSCGAKTRRAIENLTKPCCGNAHVDGLCLVSTFPFGSDPRVILPPEPSSHLMMIVIPIQRG